MTNFEKWKAELTPESVVNYFFYNDTCSCCPAFNNCREFKTDIALCVETFQKWANKEVVPDGPYCTGCGHVSYMRHADVYLCTKYKLHLGHDGDGVMRCVACVYGEAPLDV